MQDKNWVFTFYSTTCIMARLIEFVFHNPQDESLESKDRISFVFAFPVHRPRMPRANSRRKPPPASVPRASPLPAQVPHSSHPLVRLQRLLPEAGNTLCSFIFQSGTAQTQTAPLNTKSSLASTLFLFFQSQHSYKNNLSFSHF